MDANWANVPLTYWLRMDYVPRSSWMLRGAFNSVEVDAARSGGPFVDSHHALSPARVLALPDCMRLATFHPESRAVYFVIPESPHEVSSQYIPPPDFTTISWNAKKKERRLRARGKGDGRGANYPGSDNLRSERETVALSGDVVALTTAGNMIFALTLDRGRRPGAETWMVHRLPVHPDRGFHPTEQRSFSELTFPGSVTYEGTQRIHFAVSMTAHSSFEVFLSGIGDFQLLRGRLRTKQSTLLRAQPLKELGSSHIALAIDRPTFAIDKSVAADRLVAAVDETQSLYTLIPREFDISVAKMPGLPPLDGVARLTRIHLSTRHAGVRIRNRGENDGSWHSIPSLVLARPHCGQIWTVNDLEQSQCAPLVGGGRESVDSGAPSNLLDAEIGRADEVCVVHDAGLLFGRRDDKGWMALLTPPLLRALGLVARESASAAFEQRGGRNPDGSS